MRTAEAIETKSHDTAITESLSLRQRRRRMVTLLLTTVATLALAIWALGLGDYPMNPAEVIKAMTGNEGFQSTIVLQWRAPRIVAALVFGGALSVSGALFQTMTRNPLGSPDIIGFSTGSYTGVVTVVTVLGNGIASVTLGAVIGGFVTAGIIYFLAYRDGIAGFRLIIVGIGVTAMLSALNTWLLMKVQPEVAMGAAIWGTGTLSLTKWSSVGPALVGFVVAVPLVFLVARPLRQLELGDDAAASHGVSVENARRGIFAVGVILVALVTAATGPIAFVALAAPQIGKALAGSAGIPLPQAACTGAFLLLGADLAAQFVPAQPVPVGVVTVILGGLYLLVLLIGQARKG